MPPLYMLIAYLLGAPAAVAQPAADVVGPERPEVYARLLVFAERESVWGAYTRQLEPDKDGGRAYGVMMIKNRPDLEHDIKGSMYAWVTQVDLGTMACGSLTGGLRMVSSGRCDRATGLVSARESEADMVEAWAWAMALRAPLR